MKFDTPKIPNEISESYWNKKRELLSKNKKSGISQAIKDVLASYKKINWEPLVLAGEPGIILKPGLGNFAEAKDFGEKLKYFSSSMKNLKNEVAKGTFSALTDSLVELQNTCNNAVRMFSDAGYPKASSAARDIAKAAADFLKEVDPDALGKFVTNSYKETIDGFNAIRANVCARFSLFKFISVCSANVSKIEGYPTQEERATALANLGNDAIGRNVTQALGVRIKLALSGFPYPGAAAKQVFDLLNPYANDSAHKKATAANVDKMIKEIHTIFDAAKRLPDEVVSLRTSL